jgi:RNA polymerase sigma-70 factor (ECF subfamily)
MITYRDKYTEFSVLLCAGLAGDHAAYARFLENITPLLTRIVARSLSPSDVEDVVQEILISVHKARHTYDGQRPIMPWLTSIAKFRITDHLRKHYAQRRHETVDIDDLEDIIPDVTEPAIDNEYIEELLADVPSKHKQILMLMHMEGYTAKEVGVRLHMNESAVKVAAHRALKKIREKFQA